MGALDDAIREHLELKRRHGASEDEIAQAEAEALGPARRTPAAAEPDEYVSQDPVEPPAAAYDEAPPNPADAAVDAPPPPPPPPPPPAPVAEIEVAETEVAEFEEAPEPGTAKPHGDPAFDDEELPPGQAIEDEPEHEDDDLPVEPDRARTAILDDPLDELAPPAPARPTGAVAAGDWVEPDLDPGPPAEPGVPAEPGDEDVLEETPDFLQETPEHDRLWFEQKPPRDFDFD